MTEDYIALVRRELEGLKRLADGALAQVSAEQFFAAPREGDNSIAILVKHVSGNMISRWTDFLTTDGEKPDRNRDSEFIIETKDTWDSLMQQWERGWGSVLSALSPLTSSDLGRSVHIRGEEMTVLQALNRQLTHYAYHVGQVVYIAKHHVGDGWKSLSIPVGMSEQFNRKPAQYIQRPDT